MLNINHLEFTFLKSIGAKTVLKKLMRTFSAVVSLDMDQQKIVVLTGAGMSAESGIKTFRDADGLWEGHDVMEVASPEGWAKNKELVLEFYNQRRRQLNTVKPNAGHTIIAKLEEHHDVIVITQNVDDLHERAGSSNIIHLHGELRSIRSVNNPRMRQYHDDDIHLGDLAPDGSQWRPDIVWFGEAVPELERSIPHVMEAEIIIIIGTSLQVYPAAGLIQYAYKAKKVYYIDPKPKSNYELDRTANLKVIEAGAVEGMEVVYNELVISHDQN